MTVLHIMQCTNLGGMEQIAYRLMKSLSCQKELSFRVATPREFGLGKPYVHEFDPEARDFPYRGRFGWRDFVPFRAHIRTLAKQCSHIWVTGTSAAALAAIRGIDRPKVLTNQYHHFDSRFSWTRWRLFYEILCRRLDTIVYPTRFTRDEALRIAPWIESKAQLVRNGYSIHFRDETHRIEQQRAARDRLSLPQNAFVVGNAGWLIERKRFDVFLRAAAEIRKTLPNAVFIVCGGGPLESELRALANNLGIASSVRFEGWLTDLADHYRSWDVLLFNSDFDALANVPLEGASHGCPIVASLGYGGLGEFIEHGRNGYLFSQHDTAALAAAVVALARDPARGATIRAEARRTLETHFSPQATADFYRNFFSG